MEKLMKQLFSVMTIPLLILVVFGCDTAENPITDIQEVESTTGIVRVNIQSAEDVNVRIHLIRDGKEVQRTEGDGRFTFRNLDAGEYTLRISAQGYHDTELNVTVTAGETTTLDTITLKEFGYPVSHIVGLVRNSRTGIRLPEILVKLTDQDGKQYEAITSKDGIFNFDNLPASQELDLTIEDADYELHELSIDSIPANETKKLNVKIKPIGIGDREIEPEESGQGLPIFTKAPDFELPDGDGKRHSLYDVLDEGKNAIVVFYIGGA